jgi:hypothetical protein
MPARPELLEDRRVRRLRRLAARQGVHLRSERKKYSHVGWMLLDDGTNGVILGGGEVPVQRGPRAYRGVPASAGAVRPGDSREPPGTCQLEAPQETTAPRRARLATGRCRPAPILES